MGSAQDCNRSGVGRLAIQRLAVLIVGLPVALTGPALAKDIADPETGATRRVAQAGEQHLRVRTDPRLHRQINHPPGSDKGAFGPTAPAPGPAGITVGIVGGSGQIMVGDGQGSAQVTIGSPVGTGQISISRAGDAMGAPVDFTSFMASLAMAGIPSSLPLASARLTSGFGMRGHPIRGGYRTHAGVDLAAPYGSPISATSDAVVRAAGWQGGYGLLVALDHGGGLQTRYGHMSRLNVAPGQRVRKGDIIGFVGSTGLSTGPHVHYEMRINGQAVNPMAQKVR